MPSWEPAAAKFRCERLMAAYAWWCNGRASDGANSPKSEDEGHEVLPRHEPGQRGCVASSDRIDSWRFAGPDHRTHFGTHSATNLQPSCTSSSFGFDFNSYNA